MAAKIYVVIEAMDYEGISAVTPFSTYNKAKKFADKLDICRSESVDIEEREIDNPEWRVDTHYVHPFIKGILKIK